MNGILRDDKIRDANSVHTDFQAFVLPIDQLVPLNRKFDLIDSIEKVDEYTLVVQF